MATISAHHRMRCATRVSGTRSPTPGPTDGPAHAVAPHSHITTSRVGQTSGRRPAVTVLRHLDGTAALAATLRQLARAENLRKKSPSLRAGWANGPTAEPPIRSTPGSGAAGTTSTSPATDGDRDGRRTVAPTRSDQTARSCCRPAPDHPRSPTMIRTRSDVLRKSHADGSSMSLRPEASDVPERAPR